MFTSNNLQSMKQVLLLLFIISFKFSFGQSDYVSVENNNKDAAYNGRTNIVKLDSINNFTNIKLHSNAVIKLVGFWYDFDYVKYKKEGLVTHSQIFVDDNNTIFEIGVFTIKSHNIITGYYDYKDFSRNYPRTIKKAKGEVISTQIDKEKNFKLFKVKMPSKFNKDVVFTSYHLIGEKNKDIYRMVIYNIDETNFENFDKFLIETYNNN
jgi:hypothetical protein